MKAGDDGGPAQREAYILLTDLLMVFARQVRKTPALASLVYTPDTSLQQELQVELGTQTFLQAFKRARIVSRIWECY